MKRYVNERVSTFVSTNDRRDLLRVLEGAVKLRPVQFGHFELLLEKEKKGRRTNDLEETLRAMAAVMEGRIGVSSDGSQSVAVYRLDDQYGKREEVGTMFSSKHYRDDSPNLRVSGGLRKGEVFPMLVKYLTSSWGTAQGKRHPRYELLRYISAVRRMNEDIQKVRVGGREFSVEYHWDSGAKDYSVPGSVPAKIEVYEVGKRVTKTRVGQIDGYLPEHIYQKTHEEWVRMALFPRTRFKHGIREYWASREFGQVVVREKQNRIGDIVMTGHNADMYSADGRGFPLETYELGHKEIYEKARKVLGVEKADG